MFAARPGDADKFAQDVPGPESDVDQFALHPETRNNSPSLPGSRQVDIRPIRTEAVHRTSQGIRFLDQSRIGGENKAVPDGLNKLASSLTLAKSVAATASIAAIVAPAAATRRYGCEQGRQRPHDEPERQRPGPRPKTRPCFPRLSACLPTYTLPSRTIPGCCSQGLKKRQDGLALPARQVGEPLPRSLSLTGVPQYRLAQAASAAVVQIRLMPRHPLRPTQPPQRRRPPLVSP